MNAVLVTGARGFVGRHCTEKLLQAGFQVHALSRHKIKAENSQIDWHQIDLMDTKAVHKLVKSIKATHCLHAAWITTPGFFWQSSENLNWLAATLSLATAFEENGGKRFLGLGSCAEYEWSEERLSEISGPQVPSSLYGQCKSSAQAILKSFSETKKISVAWARLFFMYGPHAPAEKFPRVIIESLLRGQEVKTSSGEQIRDFLHVEDVATALVKLLSSQIEGVINVASGEPARIKDIIALIANQIGREELICLGDGIPESEPKSLLADTRRLNNELDWRPSIQLEKGLEALIKETKKEMSYDSL